MENGMNVMIVIWCGDDKKENRLTHLSLERDWPRSERLKGLKPLNKFLAF